MLSLSSILAFALCTASSAFVVPATRLAAPHVARTGVISCAEPSISPTQGIVIAGGTLGIVGAAFCTSTGSPPTGLAVATLGLLFMYLGAGFIESE